MPKRILMIAYHYPPNAGSSGVHRTLKFSQYLLEMGWLPSVLTVHPRVYEAWDARQLSEIPSQVEVKRAFALDSAKHMSIAGRYPGLLALPDRWSSWVLGGFFAAWFLIRRQRPDVIWATFPISSAILIAILLKMWFKLPLVIDLRDPMTKPGYPAGRLKYRLTRWIEEKAVSLCEYAVFTTHSTCAMYQQRYPDIDTDKWRVIANGYDEESFQQTVASLDIADIKSKHGGKLVFLHSGVLYPNERDPAQFFQALAELKREGAINAATLQIVLRATMHDEIFKPDLAQLGIEDMVLLQPNIPYKDALAEMLSVDGLLIFQAASCNAQIPAKAYEYIRAGQPILALTDAVGDTANLLTSAGYNRIAALDNRSEIKRCLLEFIDDIKHKRAYACDASHAYQYSRRARSEELAKLLDSVELKRD